ncbi:MAG: hypothetical protein D8M58_16500 [Calditrichaeota bacterium]|nr:MAG: hypothetical protein DWQ03_08230 [Calditrichota bacterium]MBL1207006.1 hypothetical protein [Calditrichota bacterium]NOG46833.1 hypothetical protein [Calditrichota bacterium]
MQPSTVFVRMFLILSISFLIFNSFLSAQDNPKIPQVAVLTFDGRGLTSIETWPLTDRFRGELVKTRAFVVLERQLMESILKEQGFQQTGCTSTECAIQAGKILNVQKMIAGSIGKVGSTWTVDVSLIDVETSRIEQSFNRNFKGAVDGLLPILKEIAIEMMPAVEGISETPLYISGFAALASVGVGTFSFFKAEDSYDKYKAATTANKANGFKEDTKSFDQITTISTIVVGTSALFYFIYKKFYDDSKIPPGYMASPYIKKGDTIGLAVTIQF